MRKRPSSLDVARRAGVSQSAVSRSFTPGASVAPKTKAKVMKAAADLGYHPNALPRMILTQRSNLVAVVMGQMDNPFYVECLRHFLAALDARGYRALVLGHDPDGLGPGTSIEAAIDEAIRHRVDGVIVAAAKVAKATVATCARMQVPVVLFNRFLGAAGVSSIGCDNRRAGRLVAERLLGCGHRRFGFASGDRSAPANRLRHDGFAAALKAAGHAVRVFGEANSYATGRAAAHAMCAGDEPCDAIFCGSDVIAFGLIDALRLELSLSVPEDVAVVGFDDVPVAAYEAYALTTVRQRQSEMSTRAVAILDSLVRREGGHVNERVPGDLIVRQTTRRDRAEPVATHAAARIA